MKTTLFSRSAMMDLFEQVNPSPAQRRAQEVEERRGPCGCEVFARGGDCRHSASIDEPSDAEMIAMGWALDAAGVWRHPEYPEPAERVSQARDESEDDILF